MEIEEEWDSEVFSIDEGEEEELYIPWFQRKAIRRGIALIFSLALVSPIINHQGQVIAVVFATTTVQQDSKKKKMGLSVPIELVHQWMEEEKINVQ